LFLGASFINPHDICYLPQLEIDPDSMTSPLSQLARPVVEAARRAYRDLDASGRAAFATEHAPPLPDNFERHGAEPPHVSVEDHRHPLVRIPHVEWGETMWRLYRYVYDRLVEDVDRQIGQLLTALDASPSADETLVVFTSDHGELAGSHRLSQKGEFYEEATRVPLIARWPGHIPAGAIDDHLVSNGLDLHPTICDVAGATSSAPQPGRSLLPLFKDESPAKWRDDLLLESRHGWCVHEGRRKCEVYRGGHAAVRDLIADPGELTDRVDDPAHRDFVEQAKSRIAELPQVQSP